MSLELKVVLVDEWAKAPVKAGPQEAGFDLFASWPVIVRQGEISKIKTGVIMEIPDGYLGLICDRSGMGSNGFKVLAGVIDSSFRGEVIVLMTSLTERIFTKPYEVKAGDKIAQMLLLPVPRCDVRVVDSEELTQTARQQRAFGSTDKQPLQECIR